MVNLFFLIKSISWLLFVLFISTIIFLHTYTSHLETRIFSIFFLVAHLTNMRQIIINHSRHINSSLKKYINLFKLLKFNVIWIYFNFYLREYHNFFFVLFYFSIHNFWCVISFFIQWTHHYFDIKITHFFEFYKFFMISSPTADIRRLDRIHIYIFL